MIHDVNKIIVIIVKFLYVSSIQSDECRTHNWMTAYTEVIDATIHAIDTQMTNARNSVAILTIETHR